MFPEICPARDILMRKPLHVPLTHSLDVSNHHLERVIVEGCNPVEGDI